MIAFRATIKSNEYVIQQDNWISKLDDSENPVMLKTSNGVISLKAAKHTFEAKESLNNYKVEVDVFYDISQEDIQTLADYSIEKIRLQLSKRQFDYKVKSKKGKKFQKKVVCAQKAQKN